MSDTFEGMPEDTGSMAATADLMNDSGAVADLDAALAEEAAEGSPDDPWKTKEKLRLEALPQALEAATRLLDKAEASADKGQTGPAEAYREIAATWLRTVGF